MPQNHDAIPKCRVLKSLHNDEAGFAVSVELVLMAVVAVTGCIAGVTSIRDAVVSEISDVAGTVQDLNNSYTFNGATGHSSSTGGSDFVDELDHCDDADDVAGAADNCIVFDMPPQQESDSDSEVTTVTEYENEDVKTDILGSQNLTNMKWSLERGNEDGADAVTDAIIDSIDGGGTARITWTNQDGDTFVFEATSYTGGPENYFFTGSATESGNGKVFSATVECIE